MSPTSPSPQAIGLWRDMASGVAQSVYILIRPLSLLPNVQSGSNREIEATVNIEIEGLRYRKRVTRVIETLRRKELRSQTKYGEAT